MPLRPCLSVLLSLLLCGCAASQAKTNAASEARVTAEHFFPLLDGHIYTYQDSTGGSAQDMFMVRVRRTGPKTAQLLTESGIRALTIEADFIRQEDGGFVLRAPFAVGNSWQGTKGTVRIAEANVQVTVPAGKYAGCLRTVEEISGDTQGKITTFFCPRVGIVRLLVEQNRGTEIVQKTSDLKSFGPPMDLSK